SARIFMLHHKLASDLAEEIKNQIFSGHSDCDADRAPLNNSQLFVAASPDVMNRVATFITVQDWPDGGVARGASCFYKRDNVENTMRAFFYACSTEDYDCVATMLSASVLADLKGEHSDSLSLAFDSKARSEFVRRYKADWPGKDTAVRKLVDSWNRFPLN